MLAFLNLLGHTELGKVRLELRIKDKTVRYKGLGNPRWLDFKLSQIRPDQEQKGTRSFSENQLPRFKPSIFFTF